MSRLAALGVAVVALVVAAAPAAAAPPPAHARANTLRSEGPAVVRALEAALLLSGQEGGVIRTAAVAVATTVDGEPGVRLLLEIDGAVLLEDAAGGRPLDLYVYALDGDTEVVGTASRRLRLEPAHRAILANGGVRASLELALPPGELNLRILVRAGESSFGVRSAPVVIPAPDDGPRLLAPPLWTGSADGWLSADPGRAARPLPAATDAAPASPPAALPVIGAGGTVEGTLLASALPPAAEADLTAQLKHNASGELAEIELGPTVRLATARPGVDSLPFRLPLAGLAPGLYTIRVNVDLGGATLISPSGVLVLSASPEENRPWPALEFLGADAPEPVRAARPPRPEGPEGPEGPETRLTRSAAHGALEATLELLAAHDPEAARHRLASLHRAAQISGGGVTLDQLRETEWERIESLAAAGWDEALPALTLYADLAAQYRRSRQIRLAGHAERLTTRLAQAYARRAADPAAADRAATVVERLAAAAMTTGDPTRAIAACRDALQIGGERAGALLGLGAALEKQGSAGEAVAVFERLLELEPSHPEARLRLALNLGRLGENRRSAELLAELVELPQPEWVSRVAHQELARLRLADGSIGAAEQLLRDGLERWPDEASMTILLAWLLESDGRGRGSEALLERVDRAPPGSGELPRYRYNIWPLPEPTLVATGSGPAGAAETPSADLPVPR